MIFATFRLQPICLDLATKDDIFVDINYQADTDEVVRIQLESLNSRAFSIMQELPEEDWPRKDLREDALKLGPALFFPGLVWLIEAATDH